MGDTIPGLSFGGNDYASQELATAWLAPPFVGFIVHLFLAGLFFAGFFDYLSSRNYRTETPTNRALIWIVFGLCSVLTVVVGWQTMYHGVNQDRSLDSVYMTNLVDCFHSILTGLLGLIVQSFLAIRASRLFGQRKLAKRVFIISISLVIL